jgi:hypothetical protein
VLILQLVQAPPLTWSKKIEISTPFFGTWFWIRTLGVANEDVRTPTVNLTAADTQSGNLKLDFWKAGFLNTDSYVTTHVLDVPSHLGKTIQTRARRRHAHPVGEAAAHRSTEMCRQAGPA